MKFRVKAEVSYSIYNILHELASHNITITDARERFLDIIDKAETGDLYEGSLVKGFRKQSD